MPYFKPFRSAVCAACHFAVADLHQGAIQVPRLFAAVSQRLAAKIIAAVLVTASILPTQALAEFVPTSWSTTIDSLAQTAIFQITFNTAPDFYSVDNFGRQADAFQFWVDSKAPFVLQDFYPPCDSICESTKSLIKGGEIYAGAGLPIVRLDWSYVGGPGEYSGGWGRLIGAVSFNVSGNTISFGVPWALLASDDGKFYYHLMTLEYGSSDTGFGFDTGNAVLASGQTYGAIIPEPETYAMMLAGLGLLGAVLRRRKVKQ